MLARELAIGSAVVNGRTGRRREGGQEREGDKASAKVEEVNRTEAPWESSQHRTRVPCSASRGRD